MQGVKVKGVREARRQGWHVVSTKHVKDATSWNQLYKWLDENCRGQYKESFYLQAIAFEKQGDANWFSLRWL